MPELPPFNNPPPQTEIGPIGERIPQDTSSSVEMVPEQTDRWQGMRSLLAWILRWLLLGAGVSGAWLFGLLVAQFFPAPNPSPPVQEVVSRRTNRFFQKVGRLPEWWSGESLSRGSSQTPVRLADPTLPASPPSRPITLTDSEQEQVSVELEAISETARQLRDRTSAVERQLGLPTLDRPLEERITNASNRLSPPTEARQESVSSAPALQPASANAIDPLFHLHTYRVTLPSDVLFTSGEAVLQSNAQPLLDNILQDIGRYQDATVVVGSYTNAETERTTSTELSYQQAIEIQRYLSQRLGNDSLHWVSVGYGNSGLGSTGGVQLSRRITIEIVP